MPAPAPRAMILAAGFGSRLGPLADERPKPLLPVCGATLIEWTVRWLAHSGIRQIVVNLHHKGELIEGELGDGSRFGVQVRYSREPTILGTGGGLRQARPLLEDGSGAPIVVVNGKLLFELDLPEVLRLHHEREAEATLVLRRDEERIWGAGFRLDAGGRVTQFLGHAPVATAEASDDLMFTGVHVLSPRFLDRIPAEGAPCIIRTAYRDLFDARGRLYGFRQRGYWWEHSTADRYLTGVANVLDERLQFPFATHSLRGVDPTAVIHPSAQIDPSTWIGPGVRVDAEANVGRHVQIGEGAHVTAAATLQRCVVWPGTTVVGMHRDTVLTPRAPA
ncbi:MAG: NDP-sugar synthase [Myxococcales bacterium FL481]|nr:MAG: NDP-sugar synthase [Myxococcales bacterium FL481]